MGLEGRVRYVHKDLGRIDEASDGVVGDAPRPHDQALRDGMWKGHGGYEIALSPVIIGGFGWLLDRAIGTVPLFLIIGVVLGLVGSVANQYYRYQAAMDIANAERLAKRPNAAVGTPSVRRSFGPVEPVEVEMSIDFSQPRPGQMQS